MTFQERTPSKAEQDAEAKNRTAAIRDDAGNLAGADPHQTPLNDSIEEPGDDFVPRGNEGDDDGGEPRARAKPIYMSPADQKRAEFAKRFKRDDDGDVPYNGNPNDPEMAYGKFGREAEPEPEPQPEPQAREQQQPEKKFTIKVRGKEIQLTEAELLERASKVEAADQYLTEGRDLLEQARDIRRNNNAEHAGEEPHRPEARRSTQDDDLDPLNATEDGQHPDPLEQAIEEIQFGDPKEAAGKIRQVIAQVSDESADQRQMNRLLQKDAISSVSAIKAFKDQHPELNDTDTERWIENKLYDLQRAEIIKLGVVDADKIPKDNVALARWHQFYRVNGANVSDQAKLLVEAKGRLDQWRGVAPKPTAQQQRREAPRVEVNVDRNARRAAIPNQPSRPSAPVPDAVQQKPQGSSRANVIASMRRGRGQLVG